MTPLSELAREVSRGGHQSAGVAMRGKCFGHFPPHLNSLFSKLSCHLIGDEFTSCSYVYHRHRQLDSVASQRQSDVLDLLQCKAALIFYHTFESSSGEIL